MGGKGSIIKKIKSKKLHNDWILSMSIFPSGNLILSSQNDCILIFDSNYNLLQHIYYYNYYEIKYVYVIDEETFISCSGVSFYVFRKMGTEFKIYQEIRGQKQINKVINYSSKYLISCSDDKTIKIWEEKNNKKYQTITILSHLDCVKSFLIIEKKNILISSGLDGTKIWNLNNFELIDFIEVKCDAKYLLSKIDEDRIIIGYKSLKVISLSKKTIEDIKLPFVCYAIFIVEEKGLLFVGGQSQGALIYRTDNYECIQVIKKAHKEFINGFIQLKNGSIVSYAFDGTIAIMSF